MRRKGRENPKRESTLTKRQTGSSRADGIYVKAQIGNKAAVFAVSGLVRKPQKLFLILEPVFGTRSRGAEVLRQLRTTS